MASDLLKAKGRRAGGAFVALPCDVINSQNFIALSAKATKLLWDLLRQLRMKTGGPINNGDQSIAWTLMEPVGWSSKASLYEARDELEYAGLIVRTRQGGRHRTSLYGFTWWSINYCGGKLDPPYHQEKPVAPGGWRDPKPPFQPERKKKSLPRQSYQPAPPVVPISRRRAVS